MSNSIVATVYSGVIRDVIDNVRKDFEDNGVDMSVLSDLERLWDQKIRTAKVATWEQNAILGEDSNQNCASSSSTHYPQNTLNKLYTDNTHNTHNTQAAASLLPTLAAQGIHSNHNNNNSYTIKHSSGTPLSLPPQVPQSSSFPALDNSNRSIPADDQKIYPPPQHSITTRTHQENEKLVPRETSSNNSPHPPEFIQRDTPYVDNDDINSDLDDTEDEDANADGEETQNIILCLYDKVTRTKNKWKCQLKDGIMSVNGRDYLFQKGNGDFEF